MALVGNAMDAQALTAEWAVAGTAVPGRPAARLHNDAHPSLSISDGADGKLLVKCHPGCAQATLVDTLKSRGLWPEAQPIPKLRVHRGGRQDDGAYAVPERRTARETAAYDYRDERRARRSTRRSATTIRRRSDSGASSRTAPRPGGWTACAGAVSVAGIVAADPMLTVFVVEGDPTPTACVPPASSPQRTRWRPASGATSTPSSCADGTWWWSRTTIRPAA